MDYQSWLQMQKEASRADADVFKIAKECLTSVDLSFTLDKSYNPSHVCVVARMCPLSELPANDSALVGQRVGREPMLEASPSPVIAFSEEKDLKPAKVDRQGHRTHVVRLSPLQHRWKYKYSGSNIQRKETWTHHPITNLEDAKEMAGNRAVLQVMVFAREQAGGTGSNGSAHVRFIEDGDNSCGDSYMCLGVLRSPAFVVGSKRSLRRLICGDVGKRAAQIKANAAPTKGSKTHGSRPRKRHRSSTDSCLTFELAAFQGGLPTLQHMILNDPEGLRKHHVRKVDDGTHSGPVWASDRGFVDCVETLAGMDGVDLDRKG